MKRVEFKILLNTIDKVKTFVNVVTKFDVEMDIVRGRYDIDAKSIMGIFSLDLSKPLNLFVFTDEEETIRQIKEAISDFLV